MFRPQVPRNQRSFKLIDLQVLSAHPRIVQTNGGSWSSSEHDGKSLQNESLLTRSNEFGFHSVLRNQEGATERKPPCRESWESVGCSPMARCSARRTCLTIGERASVGKCFRSQRHRTAQVNLGWPRQRGRQQVGRLRKLPRRAARPCFRPGIEGQCTDVEAAVKCPGTVQAKRLLIALPEIL
jgi:hypothetical protein